MTSRPDDKEDNKHGGNQPNHQPTLPARMSPIAETSKEAAGTSNSSRQPSIWSAIPVASKPSKHLKSLRLGKEANQSQALVELM
jgi:hypothetical protein